MALDPVARKVLASTAGAALVTCLALSSVAVIAIGPAERGPYFWSRLMWSSSLIVLGWVALGAFFLQISPAWRKSSRVGGIVPSVAIVILFFVISCLVGTIASIIFGLPGRWEVIFNISRTAVMALTIIFLYLSWLGATSGTEPIPSDMNSPASLRMELEVLEGLLSTRSSSAANVEEAVLLRSLSGTVKALRERVQFSLPAVGPIAASAAFRDFAADVGEFVTSLVESVDGKADWGVYERRAQGLHIQCKVIAHTLKE